LFFFVFASSEVDPAVPSFLFPLPPPKIPLLTARVQVTILPMRNIGRYFPAALLLCAALISHPTLLRAKDIRDQVIKETILDEEIRAFCALNCVGNESEGTLKTLTIDPAGKDRYTVFGIAALRNKEVMNNPFEYVLFDHTVYISSRGILNSATCDLKIEDAKVDNDYRGIFTELLRSESDVVGKTFKVPDCKRFIQ
jgi:hypothetical protein